MRDLKRTGAFFGVVLLVVMALMFTLSSCGNTAKAASADFALVEYGGVIYVCSDVDVQGNVVSATTSAGVKMIIAGVFRVVEIENKEAATVVMQKLQMRGALLK